MGGQVLEAVGAAGLLSTPLIAAGIDKLVTSQPGYGSPPRGTSAAPASAGAGFRAPSTSQASDTGLPSWVPLVGSQTPAGPSLDDQQRMLAMTSANAYNEGLSAAQAQTAAERRRAAIAAEDAQQAAQDEYIRQQSYNQAGRRPPEAPPPVLG
jgi:hypothetical protein